MYPLRTSFITISFQSLIKTVAKYFAIFTHGDFTKTSWPDVNVLILMRKIDAS